MSQPMTHSQKSFDNWLWDNTISIRTNIKQIIAIFRDDVNKGMKKIVRAAIVLWRGDPVVSKRYMTDIEEASSMMNTH